MLNYDHGEGQLPAESTLLPQPVRFSLPAVDAAQQHQPRIARRPRLMNLAPEHSHNSRDLSEFVTAVFQQWRDAGVTFLVLRNYERLPHDVGNDIDVLVAPAELARAEDLLCRAATATGYRLHNRAEFSPVSLQFHHPGTRQQIQFDLFYTQQWRGFELLPVDVVLKHRIERGPFFVPAPVHEAVTNLLTRLVYHGYVKENYRPFILTTTRAQPAETQATLAGIFGLNRATRLVADTQAERWRDVEASFRMLRRQLILRRTVWQPVRTLAAFFRDAGRFWKRLWRPPGLSIALIGPDGCGKSSVANRLTEELVHTFRPDKSLRVHWKPAVFLKARRAARPPTTDPHGKPPRNSILSLAYLGYHWIEYFLGGWLHFLPVRFRNGLVLIDRYYYDFAVDARRYRLRVSPGLVKFLFRFVPQPDLVFLLDAPAEILHSRKAEVPIAETERQRAAYQKLVVGLANARIVDCSQSLDQVTAEITRHTLNFMHERQRRWSGA